MSDNNEIPKTTPLAGLHKELGARMVPFAGYEMPVQYPGGIIKEHLYTREHAGLFDVSHMGQIKVSGDHVPAALETLVPMDIVGLNRNHQRYAFFTNENGGILDDLMITNAGGYYFLVVNAACKNDDFEYLSSCLSPDCDVEWIENRALLALQGPKAATVLSEHIPDLAKLKFMHALQTTIAGIDCFLTRSGYTGEDGFELSVPANDAELFARMLLAHDTVAPAGLGARDSLRLEAGLCLYGHDMNAKTTPVEAALTWAIGKSRRQDGERAGGFPGNKIILEQIQNGTRRRRVGLQPQGRAPVREHAELINDSGDRIGAVSSGGFSPSLGKPIAMGYVDTAHAEVGTNVAALVRGKSLPVQVTKLPFIQQRYYRG